MSFICFFSAVQVQIHKEGYRATGPLTGFRTLQDDPKLVWSIHAAKIQSDLEYKKAYEKSKELQYTAGHDVHRSGQEVLWGPG